MGSCSANSTRRSAPSPGLPPSRCSPTRERRAEFTGLLVIRAFQQSQGEGHRDVVLIPASAHGTNPASGAMAGMRVVVVASAPNGNVDLADLKKKATEHRDRLSCLMITYPSTHGVYEDGIREICDVVHEHGVDRFTWMARI